ncbi:Piso0_002660 [Millerozyma farinosa CBS 7064]|uniref:Piso0_002660 protein n=1 Tax=Pichia sorbitophila (strain ATCC MYA-4447 / BCRC 22081 / CBS 7064 / NBRC 10061 / NRRL Y-12695) TaxID=559304 RepID=G8YD71_PICSO|nr:Piso0_002660 [Millerozyma farinosa CBS 7064]
MIRSQSSRDLSEHGKSKVNFLNMLRTKKKVGSDVYKISEEEEGSEKRIRNKVLTQSTSIMNLSERYLKGKEKPMQIGGAEDGDDNKENRGEHRMTRKTSAPFLSNGSGGSKRESRVLKMRSSVPNLKAAHRSPATGSSTGTETSSDTFSLISTPKPINDSSVITPETYVSVDLDSINDDDEIDSSFAESKKKRIPRTVNFNDIREFISLSGGASDAESQKYLPISNRKSLDFEKSERKKIKQNLSEKLDHDSPKDLYPNLKLVENAVFLSIETKKDQTEQDTILDDIDFTNVLKFEEYDNLNEEYYLEL